jgi:putative addiction module CopG family antidote
MQSAECRVKGVTSSFIAVGIWYNPFTEVLSVTLTIDPKLENFIRDQVESGRYSNANEVLEAGLARLMLDPPPISLDDQDMLDIHESLEQVERGEVVDAEELHAKLRQKYSG